MLAFHRPRCPVCGDEAHGILQMVFGVAQIFRANREHFEYTGDTKINWDSQDNCTRSGRRQPKRFCTLVCPQRHTWDTVIREA